MTTRYTLLACAMGAISSVFAVDLVTLNYGNNVVNGQTLAVVGAASTFELEASLSVTLNGDAERTLKVKRYEIDPVSGTQNTFCWGECYLPVDASARPTWVSDLSETLQPGVLFNGFHAYYYPTGTENMTKFRYVWFAMDNPTDTAYVDIIFDTRVNAVGQQEIAAATTGLEVFPNPATGANMTLRFTGVAANGQVNWTLHNALGSIERQGNLRNGQGDVVLSLDGLAAGVYFASVVQGGRAVATKRVVISR